MRSKFRGAEVLRPSSILELGIVFWEDHEGGPMDIWCDSERGLENTENTNGVSGIGVVA